MLGLTRTGRCPSVVFLVALAATGPCVADVAYVDQDRPAGGTGENWETAYDDLQDALDATLVDPDIDQVWVAEGTYRPDHGTGTRTDTFLLIDFVSVYGGFAGDEQTVDERDPVAHLTVLTGDLLGDDGPEFANYTDNSYHVVTASNASTNSRLDGFTIRGGNADGGCCTNDRGGGLISQFGSTTIEHCVFTGNTGTFGGGIFYEGQTPLLHECRFEGNRADEGGAVYARLGTPLFQECLFVSNRADLGGAILADGSGPVLDGCTFTTNLGEFGGAVHSFDGASTSAVNCTFDRNEAVSLDGFAGGGAACSRDSNVSFTTCLFVGNLSLADSDPGEGGALHHDMTVAAITGCTFDANVAELGGAISDEDGAITTIDGGIFVNNFSVGNAGAISVLNADTTIIGATFAGNFAQWSGGVANGDGLAVIDCLFDGNGANAGGAIWGSTLIDNCMFTNNAADRGGAVGAFEEIVDSTFTGNTATEEGGAIYKRYGLAVVRVSKVVGNHCPGGSGGGIFTDDSTLTISGCTVNGNSAARGGGISFSSDTLHIDSCVLVGNTAFEGAGIRAEHLYSTSSLTGSTIVDNVATGPVGGGVHHQSGTLGLANVVLWANRTTAGAAEIDQLSFADTPPTVDFSCLQALTGAYGGVGNIGEYPGFASDPDDGGDGWGNANDDYGDVHLTPESPCVNTGDPSGDVPDDAFDIDGEPRVRECRLDMGADESAFFVDCNTSGTSDACEIAEGSGTDCDGNGILDECDIADGLYEDCNANLLPDPCEIIPPFLALDSGPLIPIGGSEPQSYALPLLAEAADDVTLHITAQADIGSTYEYIDVALNGVVEGRIFDGGGQQDCANPPSYAALVVDSTTFNDAIETGSVLIAFLPSPYVYTFPCTSFVAVTVEYEAAFPTDANEDGLLDICECPADCAQPPNNVVGFEDILAVFAAWMQPGGPCDVNFDGTVGFGDVLIVIGTWGPCP